MALVFLGLLLSPALLLDALGLIDQTGRLRLGAVFFRWGLVAMGLYLAAAGRFPIWNGMAPARPRTRPISGWRIVALAGIVVVALALRLYRLGAGLWFDEIIAYVEYMPLSLAQIITTYRTESQHFLFTLLARVSVALLGEGPAAFRLPAALFGVASVVALYLFARRVASEAEAPLSAALLSVSYHHVWFSQNGRGYTMLLFWVLVSSWLLVRALDERRTPLWLAYAGALALGMFTHITMLFTALAQAAWYVFVIVRGGAAGASTVWRGAVLGFGLATFLTFELYALALPQFLGVIGAAPSIAEWANPLWTIMELGRGLRIGFAGLWMAGAALVALGAGLISYARTAPVVLVFVGTPLVLGTATLLATGHHFWPRFFFFLIGFGVLIIVRGAMVVGSLIGRALGLAPGLAPRLGVAVVLLLILASATTLGPAWLPKQDYLGARRFIESERRPGDAVVTVGLATFPYRRLYHAGWDAAGNVEALDAIRARARRTWVVYTIPLQLQGEQPDLMKAIRRDFVPIREFGGTLNGGTIYVCRSEGAPSPASENAPRSS